METTQWRHGGGGGTTPWRHVNSRRDLPCDRLHSVTFRGFGARETLSVSFQLDLLSSISIFFSPLLSLVFMNIFIYTPSFFFFVSMLNKNWHSFDFFFFELISIRTGCPRLIDWSSKFNQRFSFWYYVTNLWIDGFNMNLMACDEIEL